MLSIQNIDLNGVSFLSSFQFLFLVSAVGAVVFCYHRSAVRICIATLLPCVCVCNMCIHVCVYVCVYMYIFLLYLLLINLFTFLLLMSAFLFCFVNLVSVCFSLLLSSFS